MKDIELALPLSRAQLGVTTAPIGRGGQGDVYRTDRTYLGVPLVYKEYKATLRDEIDRSALQAMTDFLGECGDDKRTWFLSRFAWPLTVVADDDDAVTGFLMPEVPAGFYSHNTRGGTAAVRINEFQFLLNSPAFIAGRGFTLSRQNQLDLLIATADALRALHRTGFAVGDLSPKNLLFDIDDKAIYFVDCDAMSRGASSVVAQAETPGWSLPEGETTGTAAGDVYKFALLALRLLAGHQDTRDPGDLPPETDALTSITQASLSRDPEQRPIIAAWLSALRDLSPAASQTPLTATTQAPSTPAPSGVHAGAPASVASGPPATGQTAPSGSGFGKLVAALIAILAMGGLIFYATSRDDAASDRVASYTDSEYSAPASTSTPWTYPTQERERSYVPPIRNEPVPEPEPAPEPAPVADPDPMPGPPNTPLSPGYSWSLMGPYQSTYTCEQTRGNWPIATSYCFMNKGQAYFYGMYPSG